MKLSVAMIVKNEEAMLAACLESVIGADEIVVCDTGSTDRTVEIAKGYTDSVFTDYTWNDDFAEARNHAMSKCTGDWILTIDADDTLRKGDMEKIRKAIEENPTAYSINVTYKAVIGSGRHVLPVLYRKCKEVFWKSAIHNHLSIPSTIDSGAMIIYGHSPSHKNDPDRTLRILKKEVAKNPSKPREMYYLAREYRYKKDWVTSLYWFDEYMKVSTWGPEKADALLMKARCLWQLQRGEEARDTCLQAIKVNTNFKEALLFMADMVGPVNRDNWLFMAEIADNSKVLFNRDPVEKPATYYEAVNDTEPRYDHIHEMVGNIIGDRSMIDIGCGQGSLSKHIKNYAGFDMVKNPYLVADIYEHDFGDYEVYVLLEVLEHLTKDIDVIRKVPFRREVVFSVPSFGDPSHVRVFTDKTVQWRYRDLLNFTYMSRYNFDSSDRKWKADAPATPNYIMLCRGWRI